jgi:hypothetical protein
VGDKIEKNELDGACSSDEEGEACTGFWWRNRKKRDHLGDPGLDESIILTWIFKK